MMEPTWNVGVSHAHCADARHQECQRKIKDVPLDRFVGQFVKTGFACTPPESGKPTKEHMWVKVEEVRDGMLFGTLNSDPIWATVWVCGERVVLRKEDIEQVLPGL
jgi:uncharacterized protein YegJ (DUF2314 family)